MKMYIDECQRLRAKMEEMAQTREAFADQQEIRLIQDKFQEQDILISNIR